MPSPHDNSPAGRITAAFARRQAQGGKALVVYVMAGDPSLEFTARLLPLLHQAGADVVELGHPFSEPLADGAVIQQAGLRALAGGLRAPADSLALVREVRRASAVPLVLMTYYNLIFRYGEARLLDDAAAAGLDGVIIPDLPAGEASTWRRLAGERGVAAIPLEAPNTEEAQARRIVQGAGGFIYLVSLKGVTGVNAAAGQDLPARVRRLRGLTTLPLAAGFGIAGAEQARRLAAHCDGVVVGSALIERIAQAGSLEAGQAAALEFVTSLRQALDGG